MGYTNLSFRVRYIFQELNEVLRQKNEYLDVTLIGGRLGEYHLGLEDFRYTEDIDVVIGIKHNKGRLLREHGIHEVTIVEVPPIEELNIQDTIDYGNLKVRIPTIEMLAVYKLMTTRAKDLDDLQNTGIIENCDKKLLQELVDDYKEFLLNPDNPDNNYLQFKID